MIAVVADDGGWPGRFAADRLAAGHDLRGCTDGKRALVARVLAAAGIALVPRR